MATQALSTDTTHKYMQPPPTNLPGRWTDTGWLPPSRPIPFKLWGYTVAQVAAIFDSIHWWIGDVLEFGREAYGEKYAQYLDLFDYDTLTRDTWVCRSIPYDIRRPPFGPLSVSFSAHVKLAPARYSIEEKHFWLSLAAVEQWSVRTLERQLKDNAALMAGHYAHLEVPGLRVLPPGTNGRVEVLDTYPKPQLVTVGKSGGAGYIAHVPVEFFAMADTETRLLCPCCGYRIPVFLPLPGEVKNEQVG